MDGSQSLNVLNSWSVRTDFLVQQLTINAIILRMNSSLQHAEKMRVRPCRRHMRRVRQGFKTRRPHKGCIRSIGGFRQRRVDGADENGHRA